MTRLESQYPLQWFKYINTYIFPCLPFPKKISILLIDRIDCERVFNIIYEPLLMTERRCTYRQRAVKSPKVRILSLLKPRAHNLDIDKISAIHQFVTAMPMLFVSTTHHGKGVDKKRKRSID